MLGGDGWHSILATHSKSRNVVAQLLHRLKNGRLSLTELLLAEFELLCIFQSDLGRAVNLVDSDLGLP